MWKRIIQAIKGGLYKLGLLSSIKKLSDHKDIELDEAFYDKIDIWKQLYKGYYEEWHNIEYVTLEGKKARKMDSLQMAKTVAQEMAGLVFNEKCEISIGDDTLSENIESVFKKNKFYKKFQDYLEYNFALGGMAIKPYVKNGEIMLSYATADCFIPLAWANDTISEAVFPSEFHKNQKKYTHLEWHVWEGDTYIIRNEVYESAGQELGMKVRLNDFFPDLEEEVRIGGLKRSLFTYFKPNTANNIDTESPLGISIFANALDIMRACDTAFDSFHREFRLGKKRIIVPAHMVKSVVDPETKEFHRYFDPSDETYEAFKYGNDDNDITDISIELRVEEHVAAINAMLNLFAMQTGFSPGTFTFDGQSMKTATEVVSEQSRTFKSKQSHEIVIEAGLQEVIESIVAVAELYGIFSGPSDYEVTVTFDDSIAEDKTAETTRIIQLVTNKLLSKKRAMMKIHGLTEEEAEEWLSEINEEVTADLETEVNMFGMSRSNEA